MALFKCKMCGGTLEINNETVATCEYCGTQQTLPRLDDDRVANLYDRANHFRRNNEFDKAMGMYERILNEDQTDAEAYWSLLLCRYGIEYVEDPVSHKRIPTVNRVQFTSVFDDDNYKSAIQYADVYQKTVYEEEAKAINEIQKAILAISQKEEPFDIFICYKESDNNGRRTPDSVLANDLYHQLSQEGFKVFFSRITLEDKLGSAYEPYIFAALNSAKVMVVLGTRPEYFNAVWVKNEWSRYLALIKNGEKKILIPAYRDMDPYDLPEEFSHLQAQDMSRLGFMQDLIRGIKKIAQAEVPAATVVKETIITGGNTNTAPLLKRVFLFLEDEDWENADEYCEKVLDIDPENALAYLGKLMADYEVCTKEALRDCTEPFDDEGLYQKVMRFGSQELINELQEYNEYIRERNETARLEGIYCDAVEKMRAANSETGYKIAADLFATILTYKDSAALMVECNENAETERKEEIYQRARQVQARGIDEAYCRSAAELYESITDYKDALALYVECIKNAELAHKNDQYYVPAKNHMCNDTMRDYEKALSFFEKIPGWRDVDKQVDACNIRIAELKIKEAERLERERQEKIARVEKDKRARRNKTLTIVVGIILCAIMAAVLLWKAVIIPHNQYNEAIELIKKGDYINSYEKLIALNGYRDSKKKANSIFSNYINQKMEDKKTGDSVFFGKYEQDGNLENGKEDIEWIVIEKDGDRLFLVSKYALEQKKYNERYYDVTWETSTLRTWLNSVFLTSAFSENEQKVIPTVTVSADENPEYTTEIGKPTQDKIFLLSIEEVNRYPILQRIAKCQATTHANIEDYCWWWLRTSGYFSKYTAVVKSLGFVDVRGVDVDNNTVAVRPALWIDLNP